MRIHVKYFVKTKKKKFNPALYQVKETILTNGYSVKREQRPISYFTKPQLVLPLSCMMYKMYKNKLSKDCQVLYLCSLYSLSELPITEDWHHTSLMTRKLNFSGLQSEKMH